MPEPKGPRLQKPATLDHLKKKKPLEKSVPVVLNDEATEAVTDARRRVLMAETLLNQTEENTPEYVKNQRLVDEAQIALEAALEEQDEHVVWVRFRSIGRKLYEELADEHPPTAEQKEFAKENDSTASYNGDTFPPALVAACAIEPKMDLEDAQQIFDDWNVSESFPLFGAAMEVCTGRRVAELGNVFGGTRS